jgi:glycosyltransferase involved in cell wall biosynthesis
MPQRKLVVIGDGPDMARVRALAGPNVELLGYQSIEALRDYMQRARAFVFAAEEDFGITPVEAQACGTPVIAFGRGGVTETVVDGETGVFFDRQTPASLQAAVERFESEAGRFDPYRIRANSERFAIDQFRERFSRLVQRAWRRYQRGIDRPSQFEFRNRRPHKSR